ncbi:MAG: hypothetical protein AB9903_05755 [Vulcanimicrobiota bacterium]
MNKHRALMSKNGDYVITANSDALYLFWGEKNVWTKQMPESFGAILGVGNNGMVLTRKDREVKLHHINKELEALSGFVPERKGAPPVETGRIAINEMGTSLCAELKGQSEEEDEGIARSLLKSFSRKKVVFKHRLVIYDLDSGGGREVWSFQREGVGDTSFLWDVSSDFKYLMLVETTFPDKQQGTKMTRLYLINLEDDKTEAQMTLSNITPLSIRLNERLMCLLEIQDEGMNQLLTISPKGDKQFIRPPSRDNELVFFGNDLVVFRLIQEQVLLFKDFTDKFLYLIDEGLLFDFALDYPLLFRLNGDVLALSFDEEKMRLKKSVFSWKSRVMDYLYLK